MSTGAGPVGRPNSWGSVGPERGRPHVDRGPADAGSVARRGTRRSRNRGGGHRERSAAPPAGVTAAWTRQRMPLPLISAVLPSALRRSIDSGRSRSAARPGGRRRRRPRAAVAQGADRGGSRAVAGRRGRAARGSRCRRRGAWSGAGRTRVGRSAWRSLIVAAVSLPPPATARAPASASAATMATPTGSSLGLQPHDTGIAPEPCPLAPGEGPGPPHGLGHRLVQRHPVLDVGEQLAVAERLAGGARQPAGPGRQRPDLVEESGVQQAVEPLGDPAVEDGRVEADADQRAPASAGSARARDRRRRTAGPSRW